MIGSRDVTWVHWLPNKEDMGGNELSQTKIDQGIPQYWTKYYADGEDSTMTKPQQCQSMNGDFDIHQITRIGR